MKVFYYASLFSGLVMLQACGNESSKTTTESAESIPAEQTAAVDSLQEVEAELESSTKELEQAAKSTEEEVDSLLNDL